MPADLQLTTSDDLDIQKGDLVLAYDDDTIRQRLKTRLQDVQGDWFRDLNRGTDWYGSILGKRSDLSRRAEFRRVILGTEGVAGLTSFQQTYTGSSRTLSVEFTVKKVDGQELDVRFEDLLNSGG